MKRFFKGGISTTGEGDSASYDKRLVQGKSYRAEIGSDIAGYPAAGPSAGTVT